MELIRQPKVSPENQTSVLTSVESLVLSSVRKNDPKIQIENVKMIDRLTNILAASSKTGSSLSAAVGPIGTLYLTATHLIFVDHEGRNETWVLHSMLASIDKQAISTVGTPLQIKSKNFQSITFIIPKERDAHEVCSSLYHLSAPLSYSDLYCFNYSASNEPFQNQKSSAGWIKFDLIREFKRMGVPNDHWVISDLNKNYQMCDTYPKHILVPSAASNDMIKASAAFRSRGRLPVLSYFYSVNGAVICRCSQPLSGFSARCEEDESLLNCILKTKPSAKTLYVVDTRPKVRTSTHNDHAASFLNHHPTNNPNSNSYYDHFNKLLFDAYENYYATNSKNSSSDSRPCSRHDSVDIKNSSSSIRSSFRAKVGNNECHSESRRRCGSDCTAIQSTRSKKIHDADHPAVSATNSPSSYFNLNMISTPVSGYFNSILTRTVASYSTFVNPSETDDTDDDDHNHPQPIAANHDQTIAVSSASSSSSGPLIQPTTNELITQLCYEPPSFSDDTDDEQINAMANKVGGKGYENENFYENIKFHFFGIENIHVMRGSLNKLLDGE